MRCLMLGSDSIQVERVARAVPGLASFPTSRTLTLLSGYPGVRCADAEVSFLSSVSATMMDLTMAKYVEEQVKGRTHLLFCFNLPIFDCLYDEAHVSPHVLDGLSVSDGVMEACRKMVRNVYSSVGFDYIFKVGDLPTHEVIDDNLIAKPGQPIIPVESAEQVAALLNMEARHGV